MGTQKVANIQIDPQDLQFLKENNYKLCFAKKVNGVYNVIWQSYDKYLATTSFKWVPVYQIFGTNTFQDNITVQVATNAVNIGLGEGSTLDKYGTMGSASTQGPSTSITLNNNYGPIHPGLNQISVGPDGKQNITPIYVAEQSIALGVDKLTPVDAVEVWFEQNVETSTMFSDAKSNSVEIDLTFADEQTRLYKNGTWSTPASTSVQLPVYLTVILSTTAAVSAALIANAISAKLTGVYQNLSVDVSLSEQKYTVKFEQKSGITSEDAHLLGILFGDDTTRDQLLQFTAEALAAYNVGFETLTAN